MFYPPSATAAVLLTIAAAFASLTPAVAPAAPGPHIADLSVLLPPRMTNPVQYRLQGSGGCFSWSWDHHDILSVQPEYNGSLECSTSARLISIAGYNGRKETAVYAKDLQTGVIIRCEVFIDIISRIKISHHSVKIDLDGLTTLRIRAFDDEENEFSSLVGLQFIWKLKPIPSKIDGVHCLVHVPLKETPLSDSGDLETQISLEDRDSGSDLFVVKGVGIGHEVVMAQVHEPNLSHISDEIVLTVAEAMSVEPPSPVFITIGAVVRYSLRVIHLSSPQVIELPSIHHRWSVRNSSVAEVDIVMGIAQARNLGTTDIIVEDLRVSDHFQTSSLHVVIPDKLCLYLAPLINGTIPTNKAKFVASTVPWYVFPGKEYIIQIKAFSQGPDAKEIYITEVNDLKLETDTYEYWKISSVAADVAATYGNSRLLKPISQGLGILTAALTYPNRHSETYEVIEVVKEVTVCDKVELVSEEEEELIQVIQLPWIPGVYQEVQLNVKGGCAEDPEDYNWFSSNDAIVSISSYGLLQVRGLGQAVIKVVSDVDPINYDEVVIEVSIPGSMAMLPNFPVEVVTGTELQAAVTLRTTNGNLYYRCDAFNSIVRWKVIPESESFRVFNVTMKMWEPISQEYKGIRSLDGPACSWGHLYAAAAGRAVLHATISTELKSSFRMLDGSLILKAARSIAAYPPLVVHQAGDGNRFGGYWVDASRKLAEIDNADYSSLDELYLVPGSAMDIFVSGGPQQWNERVEYIEEIDVSGEQDESTENALTVELLSSKDKRIYRVQCQSVGNFKLMFSTGNLVGEDHPLPAIANVILHIICSLPSTIILIANEPANMYSIIDAIIRSKNAPGNVLTSPIIMANNCTIRIASVGVHSNRRPFANASSLALQWELEGCEGLAHWQDAYNGGLPELSWERFLVLHDASGICTVRAIVIGFSEHVGSRLYRKPSVSPASSENMLTDSIQLQLVSLLRVVPEFILLVFHPEAKANLSVTGGTCFLDAAANDTEIVKLSYSPEAPECSNLMLSVKGLGVALVTVRDLGLYPPATSSALIRVANVDWIKILSELEISLMEGAIHAFDILAGTNDGKVFHPSQYMYMNIYVHLDDGIIVPVNDEYSSNAGWTVDGPHFSVRAAEIGISTVYVSIRVSSGIEVISHHVKVEVYKPLQMHPEFVYLMPGASYTLTVKGGPTSRGLIEYVSLHEERAKVNGQSGKVLAVSEGNATLRVAVYGNRGVLICEAHGVVEIGIPKLMALNSQSDQLCIGCKMPVFPSFPEGNLFSIYQLCKDYKWMVEDEKVLSSQYAQLPSSDAYKATSSSYYVDDIGLQFLNVLLGRSAGRTLVTVSFICEIGSSVRESIPYSASIMLTVVADPPLSLGIPVTWILPPFYTTSEVLPESSDLFKYSETRKYKKTIYSLLKECGRNDLSVEDPMSIEGTRIITKDSNNLACILAKDQTTGRSEIASCVRVAEVSQVRAATRESLTHVAQLAVNSKVELAITYYDDLGHMFYEAHSAVQLEVDTDCPDVVSIILPKIELSGTRNVYVEAKRPGQALVRVSINNQPRKADFILVSIGSQLVPRNPVLHIGQYVNFSVEGENNSGSGRWVSSNESIIFVDRISGEAHALGDGIAQVIFEGSTSKYQTTVSVIKLDQIIVESPAGTLTNVPIPTKGYKFTVKFRGSEYEKKFQTSSKGTEVSYDCGVHPPFIGYSKPWVDRVTGTSYCLFFPLSPRNLFKSKGIEPEEMYHDDGFMYISITASLREAPYVKGSANALFVGGFSVLEEQVLNLTRNSNKSLITVTGNSDVEIHWNSKDLLLVRPIRRSGFGAWAQVDYEVNVLADQHFKDKIVFLLPATGQTAEIDISYEPGERGKTGNKVIAWATSLLLILTALISIVAVSVKLLDKSESSYSPPTERTPVFSPVTPDRTGGGSIQSSPSTPQPFVEYVRRTVDQTPYYRRKGRFDPQNTY